MVEYNQGFAFLNGEGDAWFDRNSGKQNINLDSGDLWSINLALESHKDKITDIVEIGCADGKKLEFLCNAFNARGHGVDPSKKAIDEGIYRTNGKLNLHVSTASSLPFENAMADLVIYGFCLYLNDRDTLADVFDEAQRVLRPGGFVAITDFDPGSKKINPYKHKTGIFSFKEDYGEYLKEKGFYLIEKHSFSHSTRGFVFDSDERISTQIFLNHLV